MVTSYDRMLQSLNCPLIPVVTECVKTCMLISISTMKCPSHFDSVRLISWLPVTQCLINSTSQEDKNGSLDLS